MKPVVQVALDLTDIEKALDIGRQAADGGVEWIEAGTPLIKSEGISSIEKLAEEFPDREIVADMKTMDTGELETRMAGEAGANIVSILGAAADETIEGAVEAAEDLDLEIVVDLIAVKNPPKRAEEVEELGVDYVGIHVGIDQQAVGKDPLEELHSVIESTDLPIAIAGGLNAETAPKAVEEGASVIIVGSAITGSENPKKSAEEIVNSIRR